MASNASLQAKKNTTGVHCIAPGCVNHYYSTKDINYHRLPSKKGNTSTTRIMFTRVVLTKRGLFESVKTTELKKTACPTPRAELIDFSTYNHLEFDCRTPTNAPLAINDPKDKNGDRKQR